MPIDFHNPEHRKTYARRDVDLAWKQFVTDHFAIKGAAVADIGCGGGIYTRALAEMGAQKVFAVDFSADMLKTAAERCSGLEQVHFAIGEANDTGLENECADFILERAVIHHIDANRLTDCFAEAYRLLKPKGVLFVQDRTPDNCLLPGSPTHIRGYFFELFPQLKELETNRRHSGRTVQEHMKRAGFQFIEERQIWEVRRVYPDGEALKEDLLHRTGRSILHELTDEQVRQLTDYIDKQRLPHQQENIKEQDRWTVWIAHKQPGVH